MINQLKLSYFRQHIDRTFDFGPGINAIRGENEAGKTTVLESFAYLCFGARSLRESLDGVVTYGQSESKLRVEGTLTHLGVEYKAYRAKSGAEVAFGNERVTGQKEVTKFFESLFGADAEMAGKLMIANQKALAESLTGGSRAAGEMIEELANFSLIEETVELVQKKLVAGVTTAVEGRIAGLRAQVAEVVEVEDLEPLKHACVDAQAEKDGAEIVVADLKAKRDDLDVDLAKSILADEKAHQVVIETTTYELSQIDAALAVEAVVAPTPAELAAARAAVEAEKGWARAAAIHKELTAAKIEDLWDKDLASLEAEIADTASKIAMEGEKRQAAIIEIRKIEEGLNDLRRNADVQTASLEGKLVKETSCAFCDKDLTDVPEVVQRNSAIGKQLKKHLEAFAAAGAVLDQQRTAAVTLRDRYTAACDEATAYLADLKAVIKANDKAEQLYAKADALVTVDRSTVPGIWTWAGPALEGDRADVKAELAKLEARERAAVAFEATREAQTKQRNALAVKRDAAILARTSLQVTDANETLGLAAELDVKLADAGREVTAAQTALAAANAALATKEALAAQAKKVAEQVKVQLAAAETELEEMQKNNALIKKLRTARPVITDKLWSIVLASVTKHFSEVRGEPTSITRADNMFKAGGHPVAGLSGSAQDMLGLAIRIALTRTFLPGSDFLLLDEPAAACSDHRETRMLGMLATLGFGQIILVTHSDLCDVYADQVITV